MSDPGYAEISKLEKWFLKRLCKKLAVQGSHKNRITQYYQFMYEAAFRELHQDTPQTLEMFLSECHLDGMKDDSK